MGLTSAFDLELTLATPSLPGQAAAPPSADRDVFPALQEQLGLRLEAQRGPVEFLVIDSVQHPAPN